MPSATDDPGPAIRVWDLPTQLFLWTLALAMGGSVLSAKVGGDATPWHFLMGYLVLAIVVFRCVWGVLGGCGSRFASDMYAPATLLRYLRGKVRPMITGDKPLPAATPASADGLPQRLRALALAVLCAGAVAWLVQLGP